MPEPTQEDWYRLLTVALLVGESRPFWQVNGVALGRQRVTVLTEKPGGEEELGQAIEARFNYLPAIRVVGQIQPIAQGGDPANVSGRSPGSLGCLVRDAANTMYFLTCDHVAGVLAGANTNTQVFSGPTPIGSFVKGSTVVLDRTTQNVVDAALVSLATPGNHSRALRTIGQIQGVNTGLSFGDRVDKFGATTAQTTGDYVYKVSHLVPYAAGTALFVDQIGIDCIHPSPFAQAGDSGSLVLDQNGNAAGLLFAAAVNSNLGFANPIHSVLQVLGVSIV